MTAHTPLVAGLGTPELIIILILVILMFGAAKLPDLARNSGRALRIFKSETKGLLDDEPKDGDAKSIEASGSQAPAAPPVTDPSEQRQPGDA